MKRVLALVGVLLVAMVVPGLAVAAQSPHRAAADTASPLPFTGLDLVLLLGGCAALVAAGLVVRKIAGRLG